jgi:hypothetical protein
MLNTEEKKQIKEIRKIAKNIDETNPQDVNLCLIEIMDICRDLL